MCHPSHQEIETQHLCCSYLYMYIYNAFVIVYQWKECPSKKSQKQNPQINHDHNYINVILPTTITIHSMAEPEQKQQQQQQLLGLYPNSCIGYTFDMDVSTNHEMDTTTTASITTIHRHIDLHNDTSRRRTFSSKLQY